MCHLRWKMRRDACAVCCVTRSTLYMRRVACKHGEYDGKTSGWKKSSANPVAASTQRREQKGQGKIPLKKQPCFCCTKLTASFTNARLRALACSSCTAGRRKPRRGVAHSISADRRSRRASLQAHASKSSTTQLRGGNKKGEGKIPLKTQSSGFRPPQDPSSLRVVARSISAERSLRRRTSLQVHASETNTTKRREQKGQASTNARLRALACSSQPAAASPVEASPTASAPTAVHDAQACVKKQHNSEAGTKRAREKYHWKPDQAAASCTVLCMQPCVCRMRRRFFLSQCSMRMR